MTVAEVRGYRLRIHFDGYSECYDFWTNADSPFPLPSWMVRQKQQEIESSKRLPFDYLCDTKMSIRVATTSLFQILVETYHHPKIWYESKKAYWK